MKKILLAAGITGLVFFPDQTRSLAWSAFGAVGNAFSEAAASAIVDVGQRVETRRNEGTGEFASTGRATGFHFRDSRRDGFADSHSWAAAAGRGASCADENCRFSW